MPFSSGVFSRVYNWVSDKNSSINITASRMDTEMNGMATGLSTCILKDGTQTITANIPMSTFKFTGLGAGTANTDSATVGQIQNSTVNWIASGGTADVITATYSPAVTALVDGMELDFRATAANATTIPTFSPSGLTARTITKTGGSALAAGDIPAALAECQLRYNLANTRWELMNPAGAANPFSDAAALVKNSADATKKIILSAASITTATTRTITVPDVSDTMVLLGATQTLTAKSLQDSTTFIVDNGDATKKLAFECSGITTATTRTLTVPDASGTIKLTNVAATTAQSTPSNPTATTSATQVMLGLASTITPTASGKVLIIISGGVNSDNGNTVSTVQIRYGTGVAPVNGAAATGTTAGAANITSNASGGVSQSFSVNAIVTGLTPSTAYWIDLGAATAAGNLSIKTISISAVEL